MIQHKKVFWLNVFIWASLLLPPLFWSGNFIVGRVIHDEIPPMTLSLSRWIIAFICLFPFAFKAMKRDVKLYCEYKWLIIGTSIIGIAAYNSLLYFSLKTASASNALLLNSLAPLIIILFGAIFYKQKINKAQCIGLFLSFYGVITLVLKGNLSDWKNVDFVAGDLIVLLATIFWAVYTLWLRQLPPSIDRLGLICLQVLIAVVCLIPFSIMENLANIEVHWTMSSVIGVAYVGIFASTFAYILYMYAVHYFGPSKAGLCVHLAPMYGVILSIMFLDEKLYSYHLLGITFIALGLIFSSIENKMLKKIPLLRNLAN